MTVPKIGLRIVKSAVAVFLCFCVYLLRGEGLPFYSAVAAVLCMQQDLPASLQVGGNRVIGTLAGGLSGMLMLALLQHLGIIEQPLLHYAIISACLIPLMYLTVLLRKTEVTYITCVVFLSITVVHRVDVNPYYYAYLRIVDTIIGIVLATVINGVLPGTTPKTKT